MEIACLDLEGVLVPEIWIDFAMTVGNEHLTIALIGTGPCQQDWEWNRLAKSHNMVHFCHHHHHDGDQVVCNNPWHFGKCG